MHAGDTRAAVTPILAHAHYGNTYKWMLYGDDDTIFYTSGKCSSCNSGRYNHLCFCNQAWMHNMVVMAGTDKALSSVCTQGARSAGLVYATEGQAARLPQASNVFLGYRMPTQAACAG